jgi:hypothetical protein
MKDLLPLLYAMTMFLVLPFVALGIVVLTAKVFGNDIAHRARLLLARQRPTRGQGN